MSIKKYSSSSLKMYEQCPKKFYYNYIEKLPKKQWSHNILGRIVHSTLEYFHGEYEEGMALSELMKSSFIKGRDDNKKGCTKEILLEAKDILKDYLEKMRKEGMPTGIIALEKDFNFMLGGKYHLNGIIDRIDKVDGKYYIYDYKTSKSIKYMDDFQLSLYTLWFFEAKKNVDEVDAGYIMLRHKSMIVDYHFTREGLEARKQEIMDKCEAILAEEEWAKNTSILCRWCDFHVNEGGPCHGRDNEDPWTIEEV